VVCCFNIKLEVQIKKVLNYNYCQIFYIIICLNTPFNLLLMVFFICIVFYLSHRFHRLLKNVLKFICVIYGFTFLVNNSPLYFIDIDNFRFGLLFFLTAKYRREKRVYYFVLMLNGTLILINAFMPIL
jgi:hypothetical protein